MTQSAWPGGSLILALCVSLAACGNGSAAQAPTVDQSALQQAVDGPQSEAFYKARGWAPAWNGADERTLIAIIEKAPMNGLNPDLFLKGPVPRDGEAREAALTKAALAYADALADGYSDPIKLHEIYTVPRPKVDLASGLAKALAGGQLEQWFASLAPQTDEYRALSEAHVDYLRRAAGQQHEAVPAGTAIHSGDRDPRVPAIASALVAAGYLAQPASGSRYTPAMADAVRRLQQDYGLRDDAIIGANTLAAINEGPSGRARATAVAMERLRWLQRDPPATRIDVNTASATLDFWRDGQHADHRRVVVGEPDRPTPPIQAPIYRLVANPNWVVPKSIAAAELAGKSSDYLRANNFTIENGYYVQQPGPDSALGLVKFDMQDPFAIYLHDTPAKALFAMDNRHRSHGCVRVQDALQFAGGIAERQGVLAEFKKALAGGDEAFVKLGKPIPVRLLYHTAYLDGGRIRFQPDTYGWDDKVAEALGLKAGPARASDTDASTDIGP